MSNQPKSKGKEQSGQSFEMSLASLEKIVRDLETGDLPLETSLQLFEEGVRLSRECQERLNQAERRVELLLRDRDGQPSVQPLDSNALTAEDQSPTVKRRIVFEQDEETAF